MYWHLWIPLNWNCSEAEISIKWDNATDFPTMILKKCKRDMDASGSRLDFREFHQIYQLDRMQYRRLQFQLAQILAFQSPQISIVIFTTADSFSTLIRHRSFGSVLSGRGSYHRHHNIIRITVMVIYMVFDISVDRINFQMMPFSLS